MIYDAKEKPVSFVQNAEFIFHVVQERAPQIAAVLRWRANLEASLRSWGFPPAVIEDLVASADAALAEAGVVLSGEAAP